MSVLPEQGFFGHWQLYLLKIQYFLGVFLAPQLQCASEQCALLSCRFLSPSLSPLFPSASFLVCALNDMGWTRQFFNISVCLEVSLSVHMGLILHVQKEQRWTCASPSSSLLSKNIEEYKAFSMNLTVYGYASVH